MAYNLTGFNETAMNLSSYIIEANNFTDGWFGNLMVLSFYIVMFVSMKLFGNKTALGASTALTLLFTIVARAGNFVGDTPVWFMVVLMPLVGVYIYYNRD